MKPYRLMAGVPGKMVSSVDVKVTPPRPTLSLSRTADVITVTFTGSLQSSTSLTGPFSNEPLRGTRPDRRQPVLPQHQVIERKRFLTAREGSPSRAFLSRISDPAHVPSG